MENNEVNNSDSESTFVSHTDIIKYAVEYLNVLMLSILIAVFVAYRIYKKDIKWWQKIMMVLAPVIAGYAIEFVINSPKPTYRFMQSALAMKHESMNASHDIKKGTWPFVGSAVITLNGIDHLFIGGGQSQGDFLMKHVSGEFVNIIKNTGLQKSGKMPATFCAVAFDFNGNGLEDLVVGREHEVTLYEQIEPLKFVPHVLITKYDRNPLSLTISDFNKNKKPDIYISYFTLSSEYKGSIFNDPSHNRSNVLLQNISTSDKIQFKNVTKETNSGGLYNTFTSAFVDLDNKGYPDIVLSHDSGEIEILKNINGKRFESIIPYNKKGNWMGLGIGDINGNGKPDLFLTNIGDDIKRNKMSLGDIKKGQQQDFSHVLLQDEGDFKFKNVLKSKQISGDGFGWGALMADINLQSTNDIIFGENFMLNPLHWLFPGIGYYYENMGSYFRRRFKFNNPSFSQTPIIADLTNNGLMDLVWINMKGKHYINYAEHKKKRFITIKLPKTCEFVNAKVDINLNNKITDKSNNKTNGKTLYSQIINGGTGFGCGSSHMVTYGLKNNTVKDIQIKTIYGDIYSYNGNSKNILSIQDFTKSN